MKIGIMGGTFDPIHNGHLMLGEYAYQQFGLDEVWFMPNGCPPHKDNATIGTSASIRMQMVELAIADKAYFFLEDYELKKESVSYSYETLEYLNQRYKEYDFYFIIGADSLFSFEKWVHPERIAKSCTILAAYRDEKNNRFIMNQKIKELKKNYQANIALLETPIMEVSSRELRAMVRNGKDIEQYVPSNVLQFIRKHNLYTK